MMVETINTVIKTASPQSGVSARGTPTKPIRKEGEDQGTPDSKHLEALSAEVRNNLKMMHNVDLQFSVHKASGEIMVTVRDEDTGRLIREIPPSQFLNIAARLEEMVGLIFDQKG